MSYPRHQRARDFKFIKYISGNFTGLVATTWTDLTASALDITLVAQVDDILEVGASGYWVMGATEACLDAQSIVGGIAVNSAGTNGVVSNAQSGVTAWRGSANRNGPFGGSHLYKVVSGDIASGLVTMRLRYRLNGATSCTLRGSDGTLSTGSESLLFFVKNLGPADPN